jgi:hypothetical protein
MSKFWLNLTPKNLAKLVKFTLGKQKKSKNFLISLLKNGKKNPEKKDIRVQMVIKQHNGLLKPTSKRMQSNLGRS